MPSLVQKANDLPASAWEKLDRPAKYAVKTEERARPQNVKERIVKERGFENIRLEEEHVAEFEHRPTKCQKAYRVVVVRKKLAVEKGQERMWTEYRYYFYITNDRPQKQAKIVFEANGRCNQENLIEQLKNGVSAMRMPVDDLVSNWAYMVMASLAWTLKAWAALMLPVSPGRWSQKHKEQKAGLLKMEFKRFVNMIVRVPAQIVKTGRRLIYRLLGWNGWQMAFLRAAEAWRQPLGC